MGCGLIWGQLGDGSTDNKSTPVKVLISDVKAIAAGGNHTVFLKNDKTVWAVGYNDQGQLSNGKSGGIRWDEDTMSIIPAEKEVTPVPVMADADNVLTNVKAIAAGDYHTVFLKNDDTVWSVGNNGYGQLGDEQQMQSFRCRLLKIKQVYFILRQTPRYRCALRS